MLSENLIVLRNLKGLSQEQIAEQIGVSRQAYAKWEKGTSIPDVEKCMVLADFYGTTIDSLMRENSTDSGLKLPPAPKGNLSGVRLPSTTGDRLLSRKKHVIPLI